MAKRAELAESPTLEGPISISPQSVEIDEITFKLKEPDGSNAMADTDEVSFSMGAHRASATELAVRLQVAVNLRTGTQIQVAARSVLRTKVAEGAAVDLDVEMARIAGQMGPVVLYPYLRELVADITRRAGLKPTTLPIYQVGRMFTFEPDDLRFRQPTDTEAPKPKALAKRTGTAKPKATAKNS